MSSGTGFRVDRLRVSYGGQRVLDDTSGTFHAGRMSAIVGPNGAGKSTLVKAMLGLIPIDRGAVTLFGDPVRRHRHRIAYVPQRSDIDWSYPATVAEVTGMGRYPLGRLWRRTSARDRERVRDALQTVSLAGFEDRAIGALSGGQQRVFLARARARCRQQRASLDEDVLRAVVILDWEFGSEADVRVLCERLAAPARTVRGAVRRLRAKGLLERGSGPLRSTREGVDTAAPLVRRHRVIESYLYQVEGYGMADLHAAAESLEHDIDHETLDDMQRRLDDTVFDPHGHRIPRGSGDFRPVAATPLTELEAGTAGRISMLDDDRSDILFDLAERGVLPKAPLRVLRTSKESVQIRVAGRETALSPEQARRVFVTPCRSLPRGKARRVFVTPPVAHSRE